MKTLTFDFETTFWNKGNPFDRRNFAVCLSLKQLGGQQWTVYDLKKQQVLSGIQHWIDESDLLVGFNAKFDLHWLRNIGIDFSGKRIWDCQLGEFILSNQMNKFPSLENAAIKYDLGHKIDVIKNEYWEKGINTDEIPREILTPYVEQDVLLTEQVFLKQRELFQTTEENKFSLFKLHCQDLLVLQEMEYNGILFDTKSALATAKELQKEQEEIYSKLTQLIGNIPFNLNSGDHLSAIFYGGTIVVEDRIPVGLYKSGEKVGQQRYKIIKKEYELPRLVEPLDKTEAKKPVGSPPVWFTNDNVLRSLKHTKASKALVSLISKYGELEKLRGTYLVGWSELIEKMNWDTDMIHGQLNQCVAVTGRLSSSKPNLQNADPKTKTFCVSRYV